ncbi:hypothetical protein JT358_09040 [Micrococcales bacterium 31B]|nr:hypothetical protein [Micrococcales bacterium 31B]
MLTHPTHPPEARVADLVERKHGLAGVIADLVRKGTPVGDTIVLRRTGGKDVTMGTYGALLDADGKETRLFVMAYVGNLPRTIWISRDENPEDGRTFHYAALAGSEVPLEVGDGIREFSLIHHLFETCRVLDAVEMLTQIQNAEIEARYVAT